MQAHQQLKLLANWGRTLCRVDLPATIELDDNSLQLILSARLQRCCSCQSNPCSVLHTSSVEKSGSEKGGGGSSSAPGRTFTLSHMQWTISLYLSVSTTCRFCFMRKPSHTSVPRNRVAGEIVVPADQLCRGINCTPMGRSIVCELAFRHMNRARGVHCPSTAPGGVGGENVRHAGDRCSSVNGTCNTNMVCRATAWEAQDETAFGTPGKSRSRAIRPRSANPKQMDPQHYLFPAPFLFTVAGQSRLWAKGRAHR